MTNVWTIAKRELRHYFVSPVAYVTAIFYLLISGLLFNMQLAMAMTTQFAPRTQSAIPVPFLLIIIAGALTMRLLADEHRMGTLELLLTAPMRDWELVVGKWLGALGFTATVLAVTWVYPIVLQSITEPGIDQGPLISAYLGLFLMASAILAVGIFVSSLFSNLIAVFLVTFTLLLALWFVGDPTTTMTGAGASILAYLDFSMHFYDNLYRGVIDLSDIMYFVALTAVGLFLATQVIESRRWR